MYRNLMKKDIIAMKDETIKMQTQFNDCMELLKTQTGLDNVNIDDVDPDIIKAYQMLMQTWTTCVAYVNAAHDLMDNYADNLDAIDTKLDKVLEMLSKKEGT